MKVFWIRVVGLLLLVPAGASGQEQPSPPESAVEPVQAEQATGNVSPWELHPALETGLMLGAVTMMSLDIVYFRQNRGPSCGSGCDPAGINRFDRMVTSWWNPGAATASDVTLSASIVLPFLAQAIDTAVSRPSDGWKGYGRDVLVLVETAAVTSGLTSLLKYSVGRERPYAYNRELDESKRTERDAGLSFPSGHTSMAFAMATSWSWLYMKRHPESPGVVPVWIGSYALALTTAVLRPVAGKHFWTDIIAGAGLGIGVGLLVPYLHEVVAGKNRRSKAVVTVVPAIVEGGGAAMLTVIR